MLKRHFAHEDYYLQLVELFHDVTYRTEMGQLLDLTSQPMDAPSDLTRREERRQEEGVVVFGVCGVLGPGLYLYLEDSTLDDRLCFF